MTTHLLDVRGLTVSLGRSGPNVLEGISLTVSAGEILGVVGESGAGKSVTGAAITGLLSSPLVRTGGEIWFEGNRIDTLPERGMRKLRGAGIGTVF